MYCKKCGKEIDDSAVVCPSCGAGISSVDGESSSTAVVAASGERKWYQKSGGIILLLIFFFPAGLYLMWKYANWKRPVKIVITALFAIGIISNMSDKDASSAKSGSASVAASSTDSKAVDDAAAKAKAAADAKEKAAAQASEQAKKKTDAGVADSKINALVSDSDEITAYLQQGMNEFGQGQITALDLYDIAKKCDGNQSTLWANLSSLSDKSNEAYISASRDYIVNNQLIATKLMKYLDKQEMKYLSDAKSYIENSSTAALAVVSARTKYLSDQGFTDDEIAKILSPSSASKK